PAPLVTDGGDVRVVPVTPGKSGRDRHVPVAGGRGDLHDMAVPRSGAGPPPRRLLDVVAGLTGALEVLPAGGPTLREGDDVVVVPDRRSAPRGAAALVPGVDEAGEPRRWCPATGVHLYQLPCGGAGEQSAQPELGAVVGLPAAEAVADEPPCPTGGDGPVPGDHGGLAVAPQEGAVGHDELDLDGCGVGRGLPGDTLDEGVGHDLPAAARITLGAGGVG